MHMGIIFLRSTKTCFLSFPTRAALQGPWPELHYMKLWKKNTISVKLKSWKRAESLPHCNKRLLLFHLSQPWETNKTPVAVQNGPASLALLSQPTNQSAKASMVQVWWQRSGRRLCRGMALTVIALPVTGSISVFDRKENTVHSYGPLPVTSN